MTATQILVNYYRAMMNSFSPPRTADNERRWQEVVSLLVRGLRTGR